MVEEPAGSELSTTSKSLLSTLKSRTFVSEQTTLVAQDFVNQCKRRIRQKTVQARRYRYIYRAIDIYIYNLGGGERPAGAGSVQDVREGNSVCVRMSRGGTV